MPALSNHHSSSVVKALMIGHSGTGKTGSLVSLVEAGYDVRIIDCDNGIDILRNLLLRKDPKLLERVIYETITDSYKNLNGRLVPKSAKAWTKVAKLLDHWKMDEEGNKYDLGPVTTWTDKTVLVIDSLTMLGTQAMNYTLSLAGRLGQHPQLQDWGTAQGFQEGLLAALYDDEVKCNVIVMAHITFIEQEGQGSTKGFPSALGKALPPKVGRYFNNMLQVTVEGQGASARRKIITNPNMGIDLKTSNPGGVKPSYSIETGLAEFFKDVRA